MKSIFKNANQSKGKIGLEMVWIFGWMQSLNNVFSGLVELPTSHEGVSPQKPRCDFTLRLSYSRQKYNRISWNHLWLDQIFVYTSTSRINKWILNIITYSHSFTELSGITELNANVLSLTCLDELISVTSGDIEVSANAKASCASCVAADQLLASRSTRCALAEFVSNRLGFPELFHR